MKKLLCVLLTIVLSMLLSVPAMAAGDSIFDFLGGDAARLRDSFETNTPVAVSYEEKGRSSESFLWGEEPVRQLYEALSQVTVGDSDSLMVTDSDNVFTFIMADGQRIGFLFNQRFLEKDGLRYSVSGSDSLWDMEFPCYDGYYTALDVFFDGDISDFAESFDEDSPVSVSFRQGSGDESTETDPEFIKAVFSALNTETDWVSDGQYFDAAAETESVFTFTMADGRQFAFTLFGDSIAVDTGLTAVGTLYYHLGSTEALWSLQFPGYEDIKHDKGIRDKLLSFYGGDVAEAFDISLGQSAFDSVSVLCSREGAEDESFEFPESEYQSASDLARNMDELECSPPLEVPPEGAERVRFTFTHQDGRVFELVFVDNCAAVTQPDGSVLYYPIYHGDVGDDLMELVYNEQSLIQWKHEVDFNGTEKAERISTGATLALVAAVAAALTGGTLTLRRRRK